MRKKYAHTTVGFGDMATRLRLRHIFSMYINCFIFVIMNYSLSLKQFVQEHMKDDLNNLLLSASRYPDIDIPFVVDQISARRQIHEKLPAWYANPDLLFPSRIAAEQCSSEQTASYKQRLIEKNVNHLCDLTGGLGIDSYYFSKKALRVTYLERFLEYCDAARHNFEVLSASNIRVLNEDATEWIYKAPVLDVFYIDPARRGEGNKRTFALTDCEPDLTKLLPFLFSKAPKVIAKLSPMADLRQTIELLPETIEVHVLSVKNECKELIFVLERGSEKSAPCIRCVNFTADKKEESFDFTFEEESCLSNYLSDTIGTFLYEPNVALLKAGAFKSVSERFSIPKLAVSSHLYTSDNLINEFPGRVFIIEEVWDFNNKLLKSISKIIPKANITIRNFPLSVEELRKRTKVKEGGDVYLFATTLANEQKVFIKCRRLKSDYSGDSN